MNPEPRINTLKELKNFLSEFTDEELNKVESEAIVWHGQISSVSIVLLRKYLKELILK